MAWPISSREQAGEEIGPFLRAIGATGLTSPVRWSRVHELADRVLNARCQIHGDRPSDPHVSATRSR